MILSIQYLRGLAALLVLLSHAAWKGSQYAGDPLSWFHVGASGVDVFFVISGFVMCHTTRNKHGQPFDVARFLGHRFSRIIPLYWSLSTFALLVFLVAPGMVNSGGGHTDILKSYLLIPTEDKYLIQAGWTLSYELFFYGIFAIGLFMPRAAGHVLTCMVLFGLFALGRVMEAERGPATDALVAFATDAILVNFIYGIALYHLYQRKTLPKRWVWLVLLVAAAWIVAVNQEWLPKEWMLIRMRCFRYGVPAFLLCWGLSGLEDELKRVPSRLASYIGDASYSIYLVHPFALALAAVVLKKIGLASSGALFVCIITVAAVCAGFVCYELIEKPLLRYFRPKIDGLFDRAETRLKRA